jgi:site-specific recombinase XerD
MSASNFSTVKKRLTQDLKLAGYAARTRETYLDRVVSLAKFFDRCPSTLSDEQIRDYLLHVVDDRKYSASSLRIANAALKFFYRVTLKREVKLLDTVKAESRDKLPDIFSVEDAWRIINATRCAHHKACFAVLYTCGLRIHEALKLTVNDIQTSRMQIRIRAGKGNKDRVVPLSTWTLKLLRKQWATHRNPSLIFPAIGTTRNLASIAIKPMCANAPRNTLKAVVEELNISIPQIRLHAFRHSYATHLLDAGINICSLKEYLGHSSLSSTMVYLHLTKFGHERACAIIENIMGGK